jgi:hypothetical protein
MGMLRRLSQMGLAMAEALELQVSDPQGAVESTGAWRAGDPAMGFARVARAVRLGLALEDRLDRMGLVAAAPEAVAVAEPDYSTMRGPGGQTADEIREKILNKISYEVRRDAVREMVERAIETEARERGEAVDVEALRDDLDERMGDHRLDWLNFSMADRVRSICDALGVPFDPALWDEEAAEDGGRRTTLAPHYDEEFRFQGSQRAVVEPPKREPP